MGARRGHREGYLVSGSGGFHRWFVVGATAGRGEMPELSCVDRPGWRGLYGGVDELLEMRAKHRGKLGGMYPLLA